MPEPSPTTSHVRGDDCSGSPAERVGLRALVFGVGDDGLSTERSELREGIIDLAGHHVKPGAIDKPAADARRDAGKPGHRRDLDWEAVDYAAGRDRAPGVQRPGRGEGLRLSEKTLIGEQLTGVACEDELQAIAVLDPRQPQATTPELIWVRTEQFSAGKLLAVS